MTFIMEDQYDKEVLENASQTTELGKTHNARGNKSPQRKRARHDDTGLQAPSSLHSDPHVTTVTQDQENDAAESSQGRRSQPDHHAATTNQAQALEADNSAVAADQVNDQLRMSALKRKRLHDKDIQILNPIGPMMILARAFRECQTLYQDNLPRWLAGIPDNHEYNDYGPGRCTCAHRFQQPQPSVRIPAAAWEQRDLPLMHADNDDGLVDFDIPKAHHELCAMFRPMPQELLRTHIRPRHIRHLTHGPSKQLYHIEDEGVIASNALLGAEDPAESIAKATETYLSGSELDFTQHDASPSEFRGLFKIAGVPEERLDELIARLKTEAAKTGPPLKNIGHVKTDDWRAEHDMHVQRRQAESDAHLISLLRRRDQDTYENAMPGSRDASSAHPGSSILDDMRLYYQTHVPTNDDDANDDDDDDEEQDDQHTPDHWRMMMDGCADEDPDTPNAIADRNTRSAPELSSIPAPESTPKATKPETTALKARYEAKLASFLAARHADGPNGRPAKNRQELLDGRRLKEERRKARKKELRAKARAEAEAEAQAGGGNIMAANHSDDDEDELPDINDVEVEAARLRGGNTLGLPPVTSASRSTDDFTFSHLTGISDSTTHSKSHNPRDLKAALTKAEKQSRRLSSFDPSKRAHVEEREAWKGAAARISGSRPRDDAGLLKKSLKKKEKEKEKSRKAWEEREKGVKAGMAMKQKKRTENLQKRRPGFEGTFQIGGGKKRQ